eukprot:symbB.v1.2.024548.t1/scaffold2329.1/size82184/2
MWAGADVDRAVMPRGELLLLIQQQRRQLKRQKQELEAQQQEVDTLLSELEVAKKRKREEQDEGTEKIAAVAEEGEADEQVEDEEEVEAAEEVPEISAEAACATARMAKECGLQFSLGQVVWVKNRNMLFPGRVAQLDFSVGQDVRPYLVQYLACLDPCGAHLYGWHAASRLLAWTDGKDLGGLQPPNASKLLHRAIAEARCLALRLLCLHSLVNNGIKKQHLEPLKTAFKQSYGFEHTLTLENLEGSGLLRQQQGKSGWGSIKRQFNLFVEDGLADQDVSYAYSGYAPLSVRLVQMTRSQPKGWIAVKDALSLLHGPAQELQQPAVREQDPSKPAVVLVCFLGGITYGEIAALRRLSQLEEGRRRFLIVTTEFINPKKLFESMCCDAVLALPPVDADRSSRASGGESRSRGFGHLLKQQVFETPAACDEIEFHLESPKNRSIDPSQNQWSPIYDISAILTSIQSLLTDPNPNSPANSEAAKLWSENRREYNRRVTEIVEESWAAADALEEDPEDGAMAVETSSAPKAKK